MARRILVLSYGTVAYALFLVVFLAAIAFVAGMGLPGVAGLDGIDDGVPGSAPLAVLVNVGLLTLFALQHSGMARPWFKRRWTRVIDPSIERSTYVLAASLALALLLWQWQPLPATVWSVDAVWARTLLWTLYALGWGIVLLSTFLISHFDLFGLRQVLARARDRRYVEPAFQQPLLYRLVRHPIMVGFLIAFWAAPDMSVGRLLFAAVTSAYIVVAVRFEEHDLRRQLGASYERYLAQVPRFVPGWRPRAARPGAPRVPGVPLGEQTTP